MFKKACVDGNPAELAEARTVSERCYTEVKWILLAKRAMKPATIRKIATSAGDPPLATSTRPSAAL